MAGEPTSTASAVACDVYEATNLPPWVTSYIAAPEGEDPRIPASAADAQKGKGNLIPLPQCALVKPALRVEESAPAPPTPAIGGRLVFRQLIIDCPRNMGEAFSAAEARCRAAYPGIPFIVGEKK